MFVKYYSKLFLFTHKYQSRLLKFPKPVLNTQFRTLSYNGPTVRVETQSEEFSNKKPGISNVNGSESIFSYFRKNHEKYDIVRIDDVDLKEETNFKSLVLLKEVSDCSGKGRPEKESEMNIIPEELLNCIESERSSYSLKDIFKYIILTSKVRNEENMYTLVRYLDAELKKRVLSKKEHFKVLYLSAVLFRKVYFSNDFFYSKKIVLRFTSKITSLTPEQVVLLFYLLRRISNECIKTLKFNVNTYLLENLPKFNLDEMIVISRGFFHSELQLLTVSLAVAFEKKLVEEIEKPYKLPIYWVFRVIGFNAHLLNYSGIADFQEKILPHAGKYDGKDLVCLARTGANIGYVNLSLWEILANNFKKNIKNYSLNNIEQMVHMTVLCNIQDKELLKMSIEEFQNAELSLTSYKTFISFVYNLIHHQIYPEKLLSLLLSKDFRLKYDPESFPTVIKQKYCFINSFIEFHRPESNFEYLDNKTQCKLYKVFKIYPEHKKIEFLCYRQLLKLLRILLNIYEENFVFFTSFQPHFRKGIIMRFSKNSEAQPIPEEFIYSNENYKRALNDDHIWLFIKVLQNYHYKQCTDIPNFETQTEIREMEAFGYTPVLIHGNVWLNRGISEYSEDYVKEIINNKVQEVKNKKRATI